MSKCIRCGAESNGRNCCTGCLSDYTSMKILIVDKLESIHGKMCPANLKTIQQATKRLVKVWRKDHNLLEPELGKL